MLDCSGLPLIVIRAGEGVGASLEDMARDFIELLQRSDTLHLIFDATGATLATLNRLQGVIARLFENYPEEMARVVACVGVVIRNKLLRRMARPSVERLDVPGRVFKDLDRAHKWVQETASDDQEASPASASAR